MRGVGVRAFLYAVPAAAQRPSSSVSIPPQRPQQNRPSIIRRIARTDARAIEIYCSFMRGVGGNRLLPIDRACAIADDDSVV